MVVSELMHAAPHMKISQLIFIDGAILIPLQLQFFYSLSFLILCMILRPKYFFMILLKYVLMKMSSIDIYRAQFIATNLRGTYKFVGNGIMLNKEHRGIRR